MPPFNSPSSDSSRAPSGSRSKALRSNANRASLSNVVSWGVVLRSLAAFLVAAILFLLIVAAIYLQDVRHQQVLLERESRHVLSRQRELLELAIRSVESDVLYLAEQEALARFLSDEQSARESLEREYASFAASKDVYDQIRFLDLEGRETIRINYVDGKSQVVPTNELQDKSERYYFRRALSLRNREVLVSPFDLNVEYGGIERPIKPVIRILTPVVDDNGRQRGILVLNYLGAPLLKKLKRASVGFRGETMFLNQDGEFLQAPNAALEWGWLLNHKHSFRSDFPAAWEQAKRIGSGQFRIDEDLFALQQIFPGRRLETDPTGEPRGAGVSRNSFTLVCYVPSSRAKEESQLLLGRLLLMYAGVLLVVAVLTYYWARFGMLRRYHEQQVAESESRLRRLSTLLLEAQEAERRSLSRDLHDELGQLVTAIRLDLRSLAKSQDSPSPLLERAVAETDELLQSLHEVAAKVRPSVLDDLGLPDAIDSFLSEYQGRTGIDVRCELHIDRQDISPRVGENVYRILQEALANIAKHAEVSEAQVSIQADDDTLRMTVQDAGVGFDRKEQESSTRLGILGIRERVELLDGEFALESEPGSGTKIQVSIPLDEQSE